jgi:pantothenate kinase
MFCLVTYKMYKNISIPSLKFFSKLSPMQLLGQLTRAAYSSKKKANMKTQFHFPLSFLGNQTKPEPRRKSKTKTKRTARITTVKTPIVTKNTTWSCLQQLLSSQFGIIYPSYLSGSTKPTKRFSG